MESWRINGEPGGTLPVTDRGLVYGDGLFETIAVRSGRPRFLSYHLERLNEGCGRLGIPPPGMDTLAAELEGVIAGRRSGTAKIIVTRGPGPRGYRPPQTPDPTRIVGFSDAPDRSAAGQGAPIEVRFCSVRLGRNPALAGIKTLNRIEQVLAQAEWHDRRIAEGLMRDSEGLVVSGTMSNVFIVQAGRLITPGLDQCGIRGVMRRVVIEQTRSIGLEIDERDCTETAVRGADEIFMTNALSGVRPVGRIEGETYDTGPVTRAVMAALAAAGVAECPA